MTTISTTGTRLAIATWLVAGLSTVAMAQDVVRVTRDQSTIWNPGFLTAAAVVDRGAVLTSVGDRDDWYEVTIPGREKAKGPNTGFIFKANVEVISRQSVWAPGQSTAALEPASPRRVGVFGFGQGAYTRFAAHQSFGAVIGDPGGPFFGGGAEVRFNGRWFVNASVERFRQTGHRVYVDGGDVFALSTPATITMTPIALTAGWRWDHEHVTPYGGGGAGRVTYKETSGFADASENLESHYTSYHAVGGIEFRNEWVATAFEVQYARVPNAIGRSGASAAFGESNLGGVTGRIKVVVGQ